MLADEGADLATPCGALASESGGGLPALAFAMLGGGHLMGICAMSFTKAKQTDTDDPRHSHPPA